MRVRVHLNLAMPDAAENVIKAQTEKGTWVTIAYASLIELTDVVPVIDEVLRDKVAKGLIKKVPHAYLEGNLERFFGRWREKAPLTLKEKAQRYRAPITDWEHRWDPSICQSITYNPKVAHTFFVKPVSGNHLAPPTEGIVSAPRACAMGWAFYAVDPVTRPLTSTDYPRSDDVAPPSLFEKEGLKKAQSATQGWLRWVINEAPSLVEKPHRPS